MTKTRHPLHHMSFQLTLLSKSDFRSRSINTARHSYREHFRVKCLEHIDEGGDWTANPLIGRRTCQPLSHMPLTHPFFFGTVTGKLIIPVSFMQSNKKEKKRELFLHEDVARVGERPRCGWLTGHTDPRPMRSHTNHSRWVFIWDAATATGFGLCQTHVGPVVSIFMER